jgi:hypothetical protein
MRTFRRIATLFLALVAVVGVFISYEGICILLAHFAAGLVWWGNLALSISGPLAGVPAGLAWIKPRQRIGMSLGLLALLAWLFLLFLMFAVFGFRPAR